MIQVDRRLFRSFDWITLALILSLTVIGIMTIYSATRPMTGGDHPDFYLKQIGWLAISLTAMFAMITFDYRWLQRYSYPLYGVGLFLLIVVLFAGRSSMGAQRWLNLGFFSFQPSEFFRLIFILAFSQYLTSLPPVMPRGAMVKGLFVFGLIPLGLLIKQPDLGTGILLISLFAVLTLAKGVKRKLLVLIVAIGVISIPFLGGIAWEGLKDYQKNRLLVFIDPSVDPTGIGYHIAQSKISIGSGGITGKGYMEGTQGPLRFLPEKHTDFIFSVFAEEWGFLGGMTLFGIYLFLFLRGLDTAMRAKDDFGRFAATGVTAMFFVYFCVNTGMTLGIMPVVGVPLPFVSYGGTALVSNYIAAGILINIRTRRYELFYP
ncbi:MAG: rod shape-determining protein RodA [Nitrospirales bacterium]|nr:rod shape-determining protein RodA [Nitrospirales bacterium]